MFVMSTRNIIIPSPDGRESVRLRRGEMGQVPAWAARTAYFKALVADGKIVVSDGKKDRDQEKARKAAEEAVRREAEESDGPGQKDPGGGE